VSGKAKKPGDDHPQPDSSRSQYALEGLCRKTGTKISAGNTSGGPGRYPGRIPRKWDAPLPPRHYPSDYFSLTFREAKKTIPKQKTACGKLAQKGCRDTPPRGGLPAKKRAVFVGQSAGLRPDKEAAAGERRLAPKGYRNAKRGRG